jgi:diguanylate cyclase (GGDEF)-like protein
MRRVQKTSLYFLKYLLPREALPEADRARLQTALDNGSDGSLLLQIAYDLSEVLVSNGRFKREAGGRYHDLLTARSFHLPLLKASPREIAPPTSEIGKGTAPPVRPVGAGENVNLAGDGPVDDEILPEPLVQPDLANSRIADILSALQFKGRDWSTEDSLFSLLELLDSWYPECEWVLFHFTPLGNGGKHDRLRLLETDTLAAEHPYSQIIKSGETRVIGEDDSGNGWYPPRNVGPETSWVLQPLISKGEAWGLLDLRLPVSEDLPVARGSVQILGQALTHQLRNQELLSNVVFVDWLTQVYNRSFLDQQLPLEVERATRNGESVALLVIDLDDFKLINDTWGHDVGDIVLKEFAAMLRRTLRKVDQVFRYGGEEFVVILPRLKLESALLAAERLRTEIEKQEFRIQQDDENPIRVTVSIGGAIFPQDALSEEVLFKKADEACYRAKAAGKNVTIFARSSSPD